MSDGSTAPTSQRVGWYRYHFGEERWEWSAEVESMHGYPPGTVRPTTDLVLQHKHPEDREMVAATLRALRREHHPFSTRHRIVNVHDDVREVMMIGESLRDSAGEVVGAQGFYIDVTPDDQARDVAITEAVSEIADNRAVIDQVKGVLMLIYGVDADAAFAVLKWRSQETNVKLRTLAEQMMAEFTQLAGAETLPPRTVFDNILLTAHERVGVSDP
ncbi:PAS and ANTAR domain-containing protein [Mycolicibacterium bacteremicum]|uniref:PAS and ANTAR domain-containing protein n=1 Tax=Mycolicibacterium bacteremicum TaxID=564198 RepID=UPI0026EB4A33|nr:PAS and ANTAR domain-containing protein [Mycolicibacterium bacteremicum]